MKTELKLKYMIYQLDEALLMRQPTDYVPLIWIRGSSDFQGPRAFWPWTILPFLRQKYWSSPIPLATMNRAAGKFLKGVKVTYFLIAQCRNGIKWGGFEFFHFAKESSSFKGISELFCCNQSYLTDRNPTIRHLPHWNSAIKHHPRKLFMTIFCY